VCFRVRQQRDLVDKRAQGDSRVLGKASGAWSEALCVSLTWLLPGIHPVTSSLQTLSVTSQGHRHNTCRPTAANSDPCDTPSFCTGKHPELAFDYETIAFYFCSHCYLESYYFDMTDKLQIFSRKINSRFVLQNLILTGKMAPRRILKSIT